MPRRAIFLVLVAAVGTVPAAAPAQQRAGAVDWLRREVSCSGVGAPRLREEVENVAVTRAGTERAARRSARRACLGVLRGVLLRRGETVAARLDRDPVTAAAVERILAQVRPRAPPRFFSDGGVEIELVVALDGPLSQLLLGEAGAATGLGGGPAGAPSTPAPGPPVDPGRAAGEGTSGLVVDASGLAVTPALAPRLLGESGAEIYGPATLPPGSRGWAGAVYAPTVTAARSALGPWRGPAPRVVRAIRVDGPDLVLAERDAAEVRGSAYLAAGRVVIVARP